MSVFQNRLEPVRNLRGFAHPVQAKHHFQKSAGASEPVGTLPEPADLQGSLVRNRYFTWAPVLQYILLNKSTGGPQDTPVADPAPPKVPF